VRVLALGIALPDAQVDNYDWASAPSFFDYDAMVVDPAALSKLIAGVEETGGLYLTYADEPVADGPTSSTTVGLADLLRRRREETQRLLAKGGLVVCFAYPDVPHPNVTGFTGCHRYYWLPAPGGTDYGSKYVLPGEGVSVTTTDYEHPFADYLERHRNNILYRALFAEGENSFGPDAKVIGRSPGGAALAVDFEVAGGRVIFLPALPERLGGADRSTTASAIVTAIRNTLLLSAEDKPPQWLDRHPLPGIEAARARVEAAESATDDAEQDLEEARNEYRKIDLYRRLLWQEGKYGFDLPVRDALSLLGFINFSRPDEPAVFLYDGERLLVETEGSPNAVGMEPHYRLRQRIEQQIASEGKRQRGLIVVNGYRELPPQERPQQFEDSLHLAAETMRYCVVESTRLFEAVRAHMEDGTSSEAFNRGLMETEGMFEPSEPGEPAREQARPLAE
jgi:hypothetical protein